MNDDYLWDGTGEPDPEIQQLEQALRPLSYEPRPLEIPATIYRREKRSWVPPLAIAATIALMVIGVGLWTRQNRPVVESSVATTATTENVQTATTNTTPEGKGNEQNSRDNKKVVAEDRLQTPRHQPRYRSTRASRSTLTRQPLSIRRFESVPQLSAEEVAEATKAKEQLLLALRLASAKLNLAQKKAQAYPASLIRNQHKVG